MCVCVFACVFARVFACVRACLCASLSACMCVCVLSGVFFVFGCVCLLFLLRLGHCLRACFVIDHLLLKNLHIRSVFLSHFYVFHRIFMIFIALLLYFIELLPICHHFALHVHVSIT